MKKRNVFAYFFLPVFLLLAVTLFLDSFNNYKISLSADAQDPMSISTVWPPVNGKTSCTGKEFDCLLKCIREVETGGASDEGCNSIGDRGKSFGPYQIQQGTVDYASKYNKDLIGIKASDLVLKANKYTSDQIKHLSKEIMKSNWGQAMTANDYRKAKTWSCEDLARIHNGGPSGHTKEATKGYWDKVNECMKKCLGEGTSVVDSQVEI